jgi:hypothetical protein
VDKSRDYPVIRQQEPQSSSLRPAREPNQATSEYKSGALELRHRGLFLTLSLTKFSFLSSPLLTRWYWRTQCLLQCRLGHKMFIGSYRLYSFLVRKNMILLKIIKVELQLTLNTDPLSTKQVMYTKKSVQRNY